MCASTRSRAFFCVPLCVCQSMSTSLLRQSNTCTINPNIYEHPNWRESLPPLPRATSSIFRASWAAQPEFDQSMNAPRNLRCLTQAGARRQKRRVSKRSWAKSSSAILSNFSDDTFFYISVMIECVGSTADQLYSDDVSTQSESTILPLAIAFSTLSPNTPFMNFVKGSNSDFGSSSFSFSSSSPRSNPSLILAVNFFLSNSLSSCTLTFIDRVDHVQDFRILLTEISQERRGKHGDALTCNALPLHTS